MYAKVSSIRSKVHATISLRVLLKQPITDWYTYNTFTANAIPIGTVPSSSLFLNVFPADQSLILMILLSQTERTSTRAVGCTDARSAIDE